MTNDKLRFLLSGLLFFKARNTLGIYSEQEFKKLVNRERARADRNGEQFCIIVFDPADTNSNNDLYGLLIKLISKRIRQTDEVGWFKGSSLGVLLVNVSDKNAWNVASDIHRSIPEGSPAVAWRVLSYPSALFSGNGSGGHRTSEPLPTDSGGYGDRGSGLETDSERIPGEGNTYRPSDELDPFFSYRLPLWKRSIDIIGASLGLLTVLPVCVLIALLVKIISPGPILFRQQRLGHMGKPFTLWKFRTMRHEASCNTHREYVCGLINNDNRPMHKLDDNDPQIIPLIGKLLRTSCLDELPQLFNVLRGDMSLVGPRPCIPYEFEQYLSWHKRRMQSVPGITGLWQVNGKNHTTFREMICFDLNYERRKSLWLDLEILIKTTRVIFYQAFNKVIIKERKSDATYI